MKTAGFWISHHPFPDKIILTKKEIRTLNLHIEEELELTKDVTKLPSLSSDEELLLSLEKSLNRFNKEKLYLKDGSRVSPLFYKKMKENMNLGGISSEVKIQFGLIVHYADQRVFPTRKGLYAKPKDIDFDELQNSALDIGTPLAVLHTSSDGRWYYVIDPLDSGWVEVEKVALCGLEELKEFVNSQSFVVITKSKAAVFLNSSLTEYHDYMRMGVKLPLYKRTGSGIVQVILPFRETDGTLSRKTAYIRKEGINKGYLPYTARTILQQAFDLLNEPYGWGGMYGEQDCSRFIQEVFATVGIYLPRNSSKQAQVGLLVGEYSGDTPEEIKLKALAGEAIGGITLLKLRGHIMLFLGTVNGCHYAIHDIWAYRDKAWWSDIVRVVNRVAVTDLSLGKGSKKGSLLERLYIIRVISKSGIQNLTDS